MYFYLNLNEASAHLRIQLYRILTFFFHLGLVCYLNDTIRLLHVLKSKFLQVCTLLSHVHGNGSY